MPEETREALRQRYVEAIRDSGPGPTVQGAADAVLAVRDERLERLREENAYFLAALNGAENTRQKWRERAEKAEMRHRLAATLADVLESRFARADQLHRPVPAVVYTPCGFGHMSARPNVMDECPACTSKPGVNCSNITCCGWPCGVHLALHDETEKTCVHAP